MSNEAIAKGETAHVGRIFDICVEKNSELPESDPNRKFKGRVVFEGCHVTVETLRASATSGNPPATPPKPLGGMTVAPRTPPLRKTNDPVHVDDTSPELFREIIVRRKKTAAVYPRHQQPAGKTRSQDGSATNPSTTTAVKCVVPKSFYRSVYRVWYCPVVWLPKEHHRKAAQAMQTVPGNHR